MKKSIMTIILIVSLTNTLQARSLLEPIIEFIFAGIKKVIIFHPSNENNQTKSKKK